MRIYLYISLFLAILIATSCSNNAKPDPLLEEAFQYHQQSMQMAKEVKELIKEMPADAPLVNSIQNRLKFWNENIVEVPGFEHEHDHNHDHGPILKLSSEDMLLVQKEMLDSIQTYKSLLLRLR